MLSVSGGLKSKNKKSLMGNIIMNSNNVIIIPGLGDDTNKLRIITNWWNKHGITPHIVSIGWHDQENFQQKLAKLVKTIDILSSQETVSLIGTSAGASAALNAFVKRRKKVYHVVNVCGRLRLGKYTGFRSFENRTSSSPAFKESVLLFESMESKLSKADRSRIMTVTPRFGDELVPRDTAILEYAHNITIPTIEHGFSIAMALTIFAKPIIKFLTPE
ncbi:MAG: hypothetical protein COW21_02540 [Candidatus Aenigmarchaeota archaeon CG15_BIG_FIL_POST_REV_8_21_14_020_37_27]|nr:MAG: hypothetical protein AUJ50_02110 [Candidatus Aenigmarchaeota archaeon CG1_02_38_14]PIV68981.1 MAG: hypothetical protein COS07_02305 [Candidatus Aenigmarchaeota archaeon CG01_land_8_20_14_3_00_37_9]PIW41322.1 MAG: hypothetical protein COW21_02540 [Candidatus Aenigmarchaeota archaeon CG15_BIG_FIL_POST_REV_8_21_14_020_37_27]